MLAEQDTFLTGTIHFQDLEGGFWGIVSDDGKKYLPVSGLPSDLEREGVRVRFSFTPFAGMTFRMWGKTVEILQIEEIY